MLVWETILAFWRFGLFSPKQDDAWKTIFHSWLQSDRSGCQLASEVLYEKSPPNFLEQIVLATCERTKTLIRNWGPVRVLLAKLSWSGSQLRYRIDPPKNFLKINQDVTRKSMTLQKMQNPNWRPLSRHNVCGKHSLRDKSLRRCFWFGTYPWYHPCVSNRCLFAPKKSMVHCYWPVVAQPGESSLVRGG